MRHRAQPGMKQLIIIALLAIFVAAPVCAQTPTPSEQQIQWQLAEHDRLQRWHQMVAKWKSNALLFLVQTDTPRAWTEYQAAAVKLITDIRTDSQQIHDEAERAKAEAQLRGLPPPPSTTDEVLNPIYAAGKDVAQKVADRVSKLRREARQ
jgi:hypothetical protein